MLKFIVVRGSIHAMRSGVQTKEFYPTSESRTGRYLTPLQRKAIRELKKSDSLTDSLSVPVLTKHQNNNCQGRKRMAKKKSRSLTTKYKPFSSHPKAISTKSRTETKPHTSSWAPKSMSQVQCRRYDKFRQTIKPAPPIQIDVDILKKGGFTSVFCTSTSSTIQEDNHKPVVENDENAPPIIQDIDVPVASCVPSINGHCVRKKNVSKLFPIFEKASRNASVRINNTGGKSPKAQLVCKKLTSIEKSNSQYIIDAGQKKFGATQCSVCGMVFTASHPVDEQDHQRYHRRFLCIIKFPGWKNERVVTSFKDGRIIKVTPSDQQYSVKKVTDILGIVDVDLGFQTPNIGFASSKVAYLFISEKQKVAGCVIVEKIDKAFRLVPTEEGAHIGTYGDRLYCTGPTPVPTICGISRIWTYAPLRRKNIATRLVDAVRASFVLGMCLSPSHVAFSDPTPDGRSFAMNYFGASNVLVYNLLQ